MTGELIDSKVVRPIVKLVKYRNAELVAAVQAGKAGAFEQLFNRYWKVIMRMALAWFPDQAEAEDAAIETFEDVARGIKGFKGKSKLSTWLFRVGLNRMAKHARALKRQPPMVSVDCCARRLDSDQTLEEQVETRRAVVELKADIEQLPRKQAEAVTLRHLLGLELKEVANMLGVSTATAGMRITRGVAKLRHIRAKRLRKENMK